MAEIMSPQELAKNIQQNVDDAIKHPDDGWEREYLHGAAQLLDGHLSQGPDDKLKYQEAVQKELDKLEANGTLAKIVIAESGQIDAVGPNHERVSAGPNEQTDVHDVQVPEDDPSLLFRHPLLNPQAKETSASA
jgi:hypothetical protein